MHINIYDVKLKIKIKYSYGIRCSFSLQKQLFLSPWHCYIVDLPFASLFLDLVPLNLSFQATNAKTENSCYIILLSNLATNLPKSLPSRLAVAFLF